MRDPSAAMEQPEDLVRRAQRLKQSPKPSKPDALRPLPIAPPPPPVRGYWLMRADGPASLDVYCTYQEALMYLPVVSENALRVHVHRRRHALSRPIRYAYETQEGNRPLRLLTGGDIRYIRDTMKIQTRGLMAQMRRWSS